MPHYFYKKSVIVRSAETMKTKEWCQKRNRKKALLYKNWFGGDFIVSA